MRSAAALPDGRVLFLWPSANVYSINLWEMKTDPSTGRMVSPPHPVTQYSQMALAGVTASRDGKRVVVVHYQQQPDVFVGELDASGRRLISSRRLTFDRMDDYPHSWSRDGQTVYFESNRNGSYDIFRQRLGQPHAEFLTGSRERGEYHPIVTPDGKWILYAASPLDASAGTRRLERIAVTGGEPAVVSIGGPLDYFDCGLLSGARCVLRTIEGSQFVFHELEPVQGKGRELARVPWSAGLLGDWRVSAAGDEVAIPNHDPNDPRIRIISLNNGATPERLVRLSVKGMISGVHFAGDDAGWFVSLRRDADYFRSSPLQRVALVYVDRKGVVTPVHETSTPTWAVPAPVGRKIAFPDGALTGNAILIER